MNIVKPTYHDVDMLYDVIMPYAALSYQARTVEVDREVIRQSLYNVAAADNFEARIIEQDGKILAFGFGYFCNSWWTEPDCSIDFFYVAQDSVGTGAARLLVKGLIDAFKSRGCGWMYAGAESAISERNTKLYINLFKKFGFHDIGGGRMLLNLRGL